MLFVVDEMVARFAEYQQQRGWAPTTLRRRTSTLHQLARLAHPAPLTKIKPDIVSEFLSGQRSVRTRQAYRSDLRAFYKWACLRGLARTDPTRLIDPIKTPRTLPRPLTVPIADLLASCPNPDTRLMLALGVYAGLRRSEIAALHANDVRHRRLIVRAGKGGKDRTVPLHPELAAMLDGRTGPIFGCTPATVGRRVKAHLASIGVTGTAHQLRHTFGTELARVSGGDLLMIGALMGHASTTTTLGYTQLGGDRGARAVAGMYA
jgi:integrase/recombinase XerD